MLERLDRDRVPSPTDVFVLTAFEGSSALDDLLDGGLISSEPDGRLAAPTAPKGAYITSLTVQGFRGIGEPATLALIPGPGLTLVIGRNGSGKSSFAEALEVLFTGDNPRWAKRSAVWREGWRNLHHPTAAIEATLAVEGVGGPTTVGRRWADDAALEASGAEVQPYGQPRSDLHFLGWDAALPMYRPFLSYSELGSMLDDGPTRLHDAISAVLGLDELTAAEKALRDARLAREKQLKAVLAERDRIAELLGDVDDERARKAVAALAGKQPDVDAVEKVATSGADAKADGQLQLLQRVAMLEPPDPEIVLAAAEELRAAHADVTESERTAAARMLRTVDLLEAAISYVADHPTADCPVCGTSNVIDEDWLEETRAEVAQQRSHAKVVEHERRRLELAVAAARRLVDGLPGAVEDAATLLDTTRMTEAWRPWVALLEEQSPALLAAGLEATIGDVVDSVEALAGSAGAELSRRQDVWRPIATHLAAWVAQARPALVAAAHAADLKKAEDWLKKAGVEIRNDRFAPIADESMAIWRLLRQRSNVELGRIELKGAGTQRRVTLDVTVDGVAARRSAS